MATSSQCRTTPSARQIIFQSCVNKDSASLLKWEGVVNDPLGVLPAVLPFEYFTPAASGWTHGLVGLGSAIDAAAVLG